MNKLYLLRHAEAAPDKRDFSRPLTQAGKAAMQALGAQLRARGDIPARVLCSPALRTRQTWAALEMQNMQPVFEERIYDATPGALLTLVQEAQEAQEASSLMLVGHNPGIHVLAAALAGGGDEAALQNLYRNFPPGALAVIEFKGTWADIAPGAGVLVDFIAP